MAMATGTGTRTTTAAATKATITAATITATVITEITITATTTTTDTGITIMGTTAITITGTETLTTARETTMDTITAIVPPKAAVVTTLTVCKENKRGHWNAGAVDCNAAIAAPYRRRILNEDAYLRERPENTSPEVAPPPPSPCQRSSTLPLVIT